MNLDFSDDQKALGSYARDFLSKAAGPRSIRAVVDAREPYDKRLWRQTSEMGWCGTAIPEAYGGIGLTHLELCVLAEELGRSLAPLPFLSSIYMAAEALLIAGSEEQKVKCLPKLASGEWIGTFAAWERSGPLLPGSISARLHDGRLTGTKTPVADGEIADIAIVLAEDDEGLPVLAVADLNLPCVSRSRLETLDLSRGYARVEFADVPAEILGDGSESWATARSMLDRAAILLAFEQVGVADVCLEMARDHALSRHAFGRPIGGFQAIKHKLADIYIGNVLARSNAYFAAWALSMSSDETPAAASAARISATEAANFAAKENIQTHGGMGFTWESDCHLYYRRAAQLGLALGSTRVWKDRLASHLERSL